MSATSVRPTTVIPFNQLKIWVLAPFVESADPNIQYYYDFSQSIEEYKKVFEELKVDWKWQPVTMDNFRSVIDEIVSSSNGKAPLVFNLCDGDEINGTPGISVLQYLEQKGVCYTGSNAVFYDLTTSKITMKEAFDRAGVATPKWEAIQKKEQSIKGIFDRLGSPLIIKPAISGGSMGVSVKNVVNNEDELKAQINFLYEGYHGWDLTCGGLIVEEFIKGSEFTSLIVGSSSSPMSCINYQPVERVFHPSLPETEKFLSFDRLWEFYENESSMPGQANFYDYFIAPAELIPSIQKITLDAYIAVGGHGYARLDIRMDAETKKLYMLEINSQCGLSEDENQTSIGAILRVSKKSFQQLVVEIIGHALDTYHLKKEKNYNK